MGRQRRGTERWREKEKRVLRKEGGVVGRKVRFFATTFVEPCKS
jgi:hypothetical protein